MGRDRKTSVLQWSTFQYVGYSSSSNSYFIESEIGRFWLFIDALKARRDTQCIARLNLIKALGLNKNDRTFKVSINVRKSKVPLCKHVPILIKETSFHVCVLLSW